MTYPAGGDVPPSETVDDRTPDPPRVAWRKEMRRSILAAAYTLASEAGWDSVSLSAVAERADVSRPSVYKAFGNRAGLGHALAVQETQQLLLEVAEILRSPEPDVGTALRSAILFVLTEAERNPLLKAVVSASRQGSDSLLPYLTARPDPVFQASHHMLRAWLGTHYPHLATERLELAADTVVRMTISHLVLPGWDPVTAASKLSRIATALLTRTDQEHRDDGLPEA
ncbi:TetR family transcriptional regulator [Streptomyces bauhiniae]|uniref:TetR/AcrR family transcriptional regulator n=1 Tax=Streptomyces bauhiniae TaxID=2340725 RepID=UPI00365FE546